jgi:hypothetical protein
MFQYSLLGKWNRAEPRTVTNLLLEVANNVDCRRVLLSRTGVYDLDNADDRLQFAREGLDGSHPGHPRLRARARHKGTGVQPERDPSSKLTRS